VRSVRTPVPPRGTRDVIGTDYGRAVAAFEQAVTAAEANAADRHATASLRPAAYRGGRLPSVRGTASGGSAVEWTLSAALAASGGLK
jgi:hypothetical protein